MFEPGPGRKPGCLLIHVAASLSISLGMFKLSALKADGVNSGSTWGQSGVNLGSTWGQPGVKPGSTLGQPGLNCHRPTAAFRYWSTSGLRLGPKYCKLPGRVGSSSCQDVRPQLEKSKMKAVFESGSSNVRFKRCNQGRSTWGQAGVNLHRPTRDSKRNQQWSHYVVPQANFESKT
jgi:hypothetical protein